MASSVILQIGNFTFDPVPVYNLGGRPLRVGSGQVFNNRYFASFTGEISTVTNTCPESSGDFKDVMTLQHEMRNALLNCDTCLEMTVTCGGVNLEHAYVTIDDLNFERSDDNWTMHAPYNLSVSWYEQNVIEVSNYEEKTCSSCLTQISENWRIDESAEARRLDLDCSNLAFSNGLSYNISHNISAQAVDCCDSNGTVTGITIAKNWVNPRQVDSVADFSNILSCAGINFSNYVVCTVGRSYNIDELEGSYGLVETIEISQNSNDICGKDIWTVSEQESSEACLTTYSISGTITGCECSNITPITNAKTLLADAKMEAIRRISCAADLSCSLHPVPTTKRISTSPYAGTISYEFTYDNRPILIPNSRSVSLVFSGNNTSERIATTYIPGRGGPLHESLGIANEKRFVANVNVVMDYGCITESNSTCETIASFLNQRNPQFAVNDLLSGVEQFLVDGNDQVFRVQDSFGNYDPVRCTYSRNVEWVIASCSDDVPVAFSNDCPE